MKNQIAQISILSSVLLFSTSHCTADGTLKLFDNVNSYSGLLDLLHASGSDFSDGLDAADVTFDLALLTSGGNKPVSTIFGGATLSKDVRNNSSQTPFTINLHYSGTLSQLTTNYLTLAFPNAKRFQHKADLTLRGISFQGLPITNKWSIFAEMGANTNFTVIAGVMSAGQYSASTNYATFQIDFDPLEPNAAPIATDSISSGPKDAALSGAFSVSDSDGVITNVHALSSPVGFTVNGTNWMYSPQGFKGTNTVSFYAEDNLGAASTTNLLTLITTNNPNLNQAVITNITILSGTATLDALASPGYEHVLLGSTSLIGFNPVATNVIPYLGTNDMTPTSFTLPVTSDATFYRLNSR